MLRVSRAAFVLPFSLEVNWPALAGAGLEEHKKCYPRVNVKVFLVWNSLTSALLICSLTIYCQCEGIKRWTVGSGFWHFLCVVDVTDKQSWYNSRLGNFYPQVTWGSLQVCCCWITFQNYAFTLRWGKIGEFPFSLLWLTLLNLLVPDSLLLGLGIWGFVLMKSMCWLLYKPQKRHFINTCGIRN